MKDRTQMPAIYWFLTLACLLISGLALSKKEAYGDIHQAKVAKLIEESERLERQFSKEIDAIKEAARSRKELEKENTALLESLKLKKTQLQEMSLEIKKLASSSLSEIKSIEGDIKKYEEAFRNISSMENSVKQSMAKTNDQLLLISQRAAELNKKIQAYDKILTPDSIKNVKSSEKWKSIANWRKLQKGMSFNQAKQILGEPLYVDTPFWYYGDKKDYSNGSLQIYPDRGLSNWSEPK